MLVVKKGYTLTVKSWENDGDAPQTKSKTFETIEQAKVWNEMMYLCESKNNLPKGIIKLGNSYDGFNEEQEEVAANFIKNNHEILIPGNNIEGKDNEDLAEWFCDVVGELLGYAENYRCRVIESCIITYSPIEISVEEIKL